MEQKKNAAIYGAIPFVQSEKTLFIALVENAP